MSRASKPKGALVACRVLVHREWGSQVDTIVYVMRDLYADRSKYQVRCFKRSIHVDGLAFEATIIVVRERLPRS